MTIRKRIDEAKILCDLGYYDAALILTLVAISGASRQLYPKKKGYGDSAAFTKYLDQRISNTMMIGFVEPGTIFLTIEFGGKPHSIAKILYEHLRCNLIHEAALPADIRFGEDDIGVTTGVENDQLRLGRGWLFVLMHAVINDPNLAPEFDDIRDPALSDLIFVGGANQDKFEADLIARYWFSPLRMAILKQFLLRVPPNVVAQLTDDELCAMWRDEIGPDPQRFGLVNLTGLSSTFPPIDAEFNLAEEDRRVFLRRHGKYPETTYCLTDAGLEMLRLVQSAYVLKDGGNERAVRFLESLKSVRKIDLRST